MFPRWVAYVGIAFEVLFALGGCAEILVLTWVCTERSSPNPTKGDGVPDTTHER